MDYKLSLKLKPSAKLLLVFCILAFAGTATAGRDKVAQLEKQLKSSSQLVRHSAAEKLLKVGGPAAEKAFNRLVLRGGIENLRVGLVGLAHVAPRTNRSLFLKYTGHPSREVRWAAVYGLGRCGFLEDLTLLNKIAKEDGGYLKSQNRYPVRQAAEEAIKRIENAPRWVDSFEKGAQLARQEGKQRVLFWYFPAEPWSVKMIEKSFYDPRYRFLNDEFIWVRVNLAEASGLAQQYHVNAAPMVQLLDPAGKELERWTGYYHAAVLARDLEAISKGALTREDLRKKLKKRPGDMETMWELAERYAKNNQLGEAALLWEKIVSFKGPVDKMKKEQALFSLGFFYGTSGRHSSAIRCLKRYLDQFPEGAHTGKARYCLALSYLGKGAVKRAENILREMSRQNLNETLDRAVSQTLIEVKRTQK